METPTIGQKVRIVDRQSAYYDRTGIVAGFSKLSDDRPGYDHNAELVWVQVGNVETCTMPAGLEEL